MAALADPIALTPYPEINTILGDFLRQIQVLLGELFIGMYLYGSLAQGDFNPASSDIVSAGCPARAGHCAGWTRPRHRGRTSRQRRVLGGRHSDCAVLAGEPH